MTKPWHMARVASRRELPKPRKMMGPVGDKRDVGGAYFLDGTPAHVDNTKPCCGYHVCSCEEDDNPGMQFTLAEREKMARIGGTAGYIEACRDRMAAISGLNSVARGESEQPQPYSITQSDGVEQKIITPEQPKPEPIGRDYKFPLYVMVPAIDWGKVE